METEVHEIQLGDGTIWKVLKRGDSVCIVDSEGRSRHRSKGQINTAFHLAMYLARFPLHSEPNRDASDRREAEKFMKGERD